MIQSTNFENLYGFEFSAMRTPTFGVKKNFPKGSIIKCHFYMRICHTKVQNTTIYYSGCSVSGRPVTFECINQFTQKKIDNCLFR
jgi:hypothetical protein